MHKPLAILTVLTLCNGLSQAQCDFAWRASYVSPDPQGGDQFGRAMSIGGARLVASAWGRENTTGGAYVYLNTPRGLLLEATLIPSDAVPGVMCGTSAYMNADGDLVGISGLGDSSMAPGSGALYVFRRTPEGWVEEAKLVAPDGAAGDAFGSAVAIGSDTIVVGARGVDTPPYFYEGGAIYVFRFDGQAWGLESKFVPPDLDIGDRFGEHLSLDRDRFAVGVPLKDNEAGDNAGAVYVYADGDTGWQLESRLLASGARPGGGFGRSVAIDGRDLLAGSNLGDDATMAGSVHRFVRDPATGGWSEQDVFGAPQALDYDFFGETLDLFDGTAVVSSRRGAGTATSVHVFRLSPAGARWVQTLAIPAGTGPAMQNNTVALGRGLAAIGEATHAGNIAFEPFRMDLYTTCTFTRGVKPSGGTRPRP
jgi:hypothetical protein